MSDFDLDVVTGTDHVAVITFRRGANNYFSEALLDALAGALDDLAQQGDARAVVLNGAGKHFCAGADLTGGASNAEIGVSEEPGARHIYDAAVRLFSQPLPMVAAIQGAAVGGGLGLALACDLRVGARSARFSAPFARLGVHHGFGLSVTLPLVVGHQRAIELLYTGRRLTGAEAASIGLVDQLADDGQALHAAHALAAEIAASAPLAVGAIRATLRGHRADAVRVATDHEKAQQAVHFATADTLEGVRADAERRLPRFEGR